MVIARTGLNRCKSNDKIGACWIVPRRIECCKLHIEKNKADIEWESFLVLRIFESCASFIDISRWIRKQIFNYLL